MPHYQNRNGSTELEAPIEGITLDYDRDTLSQELQDRGHPIGSRTDLTSGLSIIHVMRKDGGNGHQGGGKWHKHGHKHSRTARIIACMEGRELIENILTHYDAKVALAKASRQLRFRAPPQADLLD